MGAWVSISPANPTAPVSTQHSTGHGPGECDADDTPPAQPPIIATQAQNANTGGLKTSTNTIKQQRQQAPPRRHSGIRKQPPHRAGILSGTANSPTLTQPATPTPKPAAVNTNEPPPDRREKPGFDDRSPTLDTLAAAPAGT